MEVDEVPKIWRFIQDDWPVVSCFQMEFVRRGRDREWDEFSWLNVKGYGNLYGTNEGQHSETKGKKIYIYKEKKK